MDTAAPGVVVESSVEEEDDTSKWSASSILHNIKAKLDKSSQDKKQDPQQKECSAKLSYELAAVTSREAGVVPKVKADTEKGAPRKDGELREGKDSREEEASSRKQGTVGSDEVGTGYEEDSEASSAVEEAPSHSTKHLGHDSKDKEIDASVEEVKAPGLVERAKAETEAISETVQKKLGFKQ